MSTPEFPTEQPLSAPSNLATWGTRAAGYIIDILPALILGLLIRNAQVIGFLVSVGYVAYMGYLDGMTGQTPGKAIMGTRLVDQQGNVIGSGGGIGRKFLHIADSLVCGLGYFLPLVDAKRQTIADKIMSTYVVTGIEKKPFSVSLWAPPSTD